MKLSVLMPVYNEFATLSGAVKAVPAVDYPCEMELVIVEQGAAEQRFVLPRLRQAAQRLGDRHPWWWTFNMNLALR